MSHIMFLIDLEQGHFLATLRLAKELRARGHQVTYVSLADCEAMVRDQGFPFMPMLPVQLPVGFGERLRAKCRHDYRQLLIEAQAHYFGPLVRGEALNGIMAELKPDVVLVNSLFPTEALAVHYRYGVPVILISSMLPKLRRRERNHEVVAVVCNQADGPADFLLLLSSAGVQIHNLSDIVELALRLPELLLAPSVMPSVSDEDPGLYRGGIGADTERYEPHGTVFETQASGSNIFCSLGSQCHLYRQASRRFFEAVCHVSRKRRDWNLALAVGPVFDIRELGCNDGSLRAGNWFPQIAALAQSSVMVTHGGMGSVQEAILMGVPLIVYPLARDQIENARWVADTDLGIVLDSEHMSADKLEGAIDRILREAKFVANTAQMRERFQNDNGIRTGIHLVERIAAGTLGLRPAVPA